ncbi:MAG: response regulator [Acidobacteriota bacterium]|nr:response regulator [Acidobacteriota bacterium]
MSESKKIIIVEDDAILLKVLNVELLSNGFETLSAVNGESGLDLIRKEKPDLVLLDLLMPKMNGFKVLEALKNDEQLSKIPVVVLSNLSQKADIEKAKDLGAIDFYEKATTDLSKLVEKINKLC